MKKCDKCDVELQENDEKYCESCYDLALYLINVWIDNKQGLITEQEADQLAKRAFIRNTMERGV